jgi:integrase
MPLKLVKPREGKSPNYTIRGTYLGIYVDRSCRTGREAVARKQLRDIAGAIERGEYLEKPLPAGAPSFMSAAIAYMRSGGERSEGLARLMEHFGDTLLVDIDQDAIDDAALRLYPAVTPATRNRKVYTPVSAVLHHAKVDIAIKRPRGSKGRQRTDFLTPEDASAIIAAADEEFALLLRFLLYTGVRIGEALALTWENIDRGLAYVGKTKNGDPRTVRIRADLLADLEQTRQAHGKVFKFRRGGGLKNRLVRARMIASGVTPRKRGRADTALMRRPPAHRLSWVTFHTFRHTWATWLRRYGGADLQGLVATGNWRDPRSAARYAHVVARDEWSRVDDMPAIRKRG